ncbi:hypothetical protein MAPG_09346 [Magnaporthiopsis poae ATCC 64411]|uniref:Major facilitator superfamily (MFS) profile domain-containing protein n=1 Tax=Magnaporthiopsis poae (strain ATCC 64411 / 73-15) TaxID=644358 RepID=A0A0C4E9Q0_MAGP6|nr:hypothetical protein MAPG_09346 [Magnaporthiopsis poae ATCC 64411]
MPNSISLRPSLDEQTPFLSSHARTSSAATMALETATSRTSDDANSLADVPANCFDGTTKLVVGDDSVLLIPSPSQDPRDPVNLSEWRKAAVTGILILYSMSGLTLVTALSALIVFIKPEYEAAGITESQISGLLTYPNLLLGVGNIISMPLATAVGRRPVMLGSTVLLVLSAILCATNQNFYWHLGARCLAALSAAQCEALVLLMLQDIYFLHQRARVLQWMSSIQVITNSSLVIACSYVAAALGWRAWYWIFVALSALACLLTIFFVPETAYDRPIESYIGAGSSYKSAQDCEDADTKATTEVSQQQVLPGTPLASPTSATHMVSSIDADAGKQTPGLRQKTTHFATLTTRDERPLDLDRYPPRTLASDMRIFAKKPNWAAAVRTVREICSVFWFPNVLLVSAFNGLIMGADIAIQITYGTALVSPPYNWAPTSVSLIQLGQIAVALVAVPLVGTASDKGIKWLARRRGGVHEPERRLLTMILPLLLAVLLTGMYGFVLANPERYHWMAIAFTVDAYLYILLAASTAGTTYLIDAYPRRAGAILVILPVTRGLVSFGVSSGTVDYISQIGAPNVYGIYAGLIALFGLFGCVLYWKGKAVRRFCTRRSAGSA